MLFCKKCNCCGIGKFGTQTFANICFRRNLKNSFVMIPNMFKSLCVEKPHCDELNGTKYLVTTGKGILTEGSQEIKGIYTLTLADSRTVDGFNLSFISINPTGPSHTFLMGVLGGVSITVECSGSSSKKSKNTTMNNQVSDSNNALVSGKKIISARMLTIYADGQTKEEDLSNQFQSLL